MKLILTGTPASFGYVEGEVRIITSIREITDLTGNEIIVVENSHPQFALALMNSKGVISERGGIVCHLAIVSRELCIPMIVNVENATKILKNGDKIYLDAKEGKIFGEI